MDNENDYIEFKHDVERRRAQSEEKYKDNSKRRLSNILKKKFYLKLLKLSMVKQKV